jgi:hypothetical protein
MVVPIVPFTNQPVWTHILQQQLLDSLLVGILLAFVLSSTGISAASDHSLHCPGPHGAVGVGMDAANCNSDIEMVSHPIGFPPDALHPHCIVQCSLADLAQIGLLIGTLLLTARLARTALTTRLQLQQPPLPPPPQTA